MASTKETIKSNCQSSSTFVSVGVGTDEINRGMGQPFELKDHPLYNDVVLKILFEFMSGNDLKNSRLVCKKWCVLSVLSLDTSRSIFSVKLQGYNVEMTRRLTEFVQVFRDNTLGIPFKKYDLDPFCTSEDPGKEFLAMCGSTAKTVFLGQDYSRDVSTMNVEDISELLKYMPNIEYFVISSRIQSKNGDVVKLFSDDSSSKPTLKFLKKLFICDRDVDKSRELCPTFIEELLSVAPNITDFTVDDVKYDPDRSRTDEVLKAIEKFERGPIITSLQIVNGRTEHLDALRKLAENGLKLKDFDFSYLFSGRRDEGPDPIEFLPVLASLLKKSIERLNVDVICEGFIHLPHMSNLKTLVLNISRDFDTKSVNLKKLFPALKELGLYYWWGGEREWEEFLPNSEPCPNLKSFTIQGFMKIQIFDQILNIFPNLTQLGLDVNTDGVQILRKIMTELTQLEVLCVDGTVEGIESIDALLIGIPVERLQQLEPVVTELKEMTVQLRAEVIRHYRDRYCQLPSIANLTNLKHLSLSTTGRGDAEAGEDGQGRETRMTEVFLFFGLYSMKHINKLEIHDCEFTKSGCEILTTEMGLETWTFRDENDVDIIPVVR